MRMVLVMGANDKGKIGPDSNFFRILIKLRFEIPNPLGVETAGKLSVDARPQLR